MSRRIRVKFMKKQGRKSREKGGKKPGKKKRERERNDHSFASNQ